MMTSFQREVCALQNLRHETVVPFYGITMRHAHEREEQTYMYLYIFMKYMSHVSKCNVIVVYNSGSFEQNFEA